MLTTLVFPSESDLLDEICNRRIKDFIFFESGQQFLRLFLHICRKNTAVENIFEDTISLKLISPVIKQINRRNLVLL